MIDLFFYWSSVTVWLFPMLFVLGGLAFMTLDWLTASASEHRFDLDDYLGVSRFFGKIDDLFLTILVVIGLGELVIVVTALVCNDPVVETFHTLAVSTSSSFGWVGVIALSLVTYWVVARKVFKIYYSVADKLSKR